MGLLVKMDMSNFFNSFSEEMVRDGLTHHGFNDREQDGIIQDSMMDVSFTSPIVKDILKELIRPSLKFSATHAFEATHKFCAIDAMAEIFLYMAGKATEEITDRELKDVIYSKARGSVCGRASEKDSSAVRAIVRSILKCGPNTGFGKKMLFQGGPSSPFLSNIAFKGLDYRIDAYVKACGGFYTRYADDMCLSFKDRRTTKDINMFIHGISKIVKDGGFIVNKEKTTVTGSGKAQRIVGYCVNSGSPTIPQSYRKKVYREIMSCQSDNLAPFTGNKICKMEGMIAYIETASPDAADKLRVELSKINNQHSKRKIEI